MTPSADSPLAGAKVVKVLDEVRLVINRGREQSVSTKQRFVIYTLGEELFDPDTRASLGKLEIVRGTGTAEHVQDKMATILSDKFMSRTVKSSQSLFGIGAQEDTVRERVPFEEASEGDLAKPI